MVDQGSEGAVKRKLLDLAEKMVTTSKQRAASCREMADLARTQYEKMEAYAKSAEAEAMHATKRFKPFLDSAGRGTCEVKVEEKEAEVTLTAEEEALLVAAEQGAPAPGTTLNGYPIEMQPHYNPQLETLLANKTLALVRAREGNTVLQSIAPGENGKRSDVYDHRELFKQVVPRFFWKNYMWARNAPPDWS